MISITDDMLCGEATGQDSCQGDSGGPFTVEVVGMFYFSVTWMMNGDGNIVGDPSLWRWLSVTCMMSADGDQVGVFHHGGSRPLDFGVEQRSDHPFLVDVVVGWGLVDSDHVDNNENNEGDEDRS